MSKEKQDPLTILEYPSFSTKVQIIENGANIREKKGVVIHLMITPEKTKSKTGEKLKSSAPLLQDYPFFNAQSKELLQTPIGWFYGIGTSETIDIDSFSELMQELIQKAIQTIETVVLDIPPQVIAKLTITHITNILATALGTSLYPVDFLKKKSVHTKVKVKKIYIAILKKYHVDFNKYFNKYFILAKHMNAMRQTQALPGNYFTPQTAEFRAKDIAKKFKLKTKILGKKQLESIGAGGILAVAQGSTKEPRLIVLEYKPTGTSKKHPTLALIGKGVTFDTGGISIKPSGDMHEMKYDMSGSGAALHALAAIAELKIPIHAVAVVGMVENMPGGSAFKPGDVYTALNGLTIEVQNTDAEGRLVLGDLLHYAEKYYKPDLMIDLATLTGACMVALGQYYAGCFSRHEKVISLIQSASKDSMEPIWPLPIDKRFTKLLKSNIADHNNIGGRYGGASVAAGFLSLFVDKKTNWAHLDIAGIGILKSAFQLYPSPASGYGVRLLADIAEKLSRQSKLLS